MRVTGQAESLCLNPTFSDREGTLRTACRSEPVPLQFGCEREPNIDGSVRSKFGPKSSRRGRNATTEGAIEQHASRPDQVLQVIDLDTEVDPGQATVKARAGEPIFDLQAAKNDSEPAA